MQTHRHVGCYLAGHLHPMESYGQFRRHDVIHHYTAEYVYYFLEYFCRHIFVDFSDPNTGRQAQPCMENNPAAHTWPVVVPLRPFLPFLVSLP